MPLKEHKSRFLIEIAYDGTIIMSTPRATGILGYRYNELKGRSIYNLISPDALSDFRKDLHRHIERRLPIEGIVTKMLTKSGDLIYVIVTGVSVQPHGEFYYHLTFMDISDHFRREMELKKAKEEAELYLDLMAHDINNMNQIGMGYIELVLESGSFDQDVRELLEKPMNVFMSISQLIRNVEKIRSLKHSSGNMERISLTEVLISYERDFTPVAGREVTISYDLKEDCHVMGNVLIKEVFSNIIDNAIKHSPPEKPLNINISLDTIDQNGKSFCRVAVEDDGPGIQNEVKQSLKQRMKGSGVRRERGIGLILAGLLIDSYKGEILIEDRVPGDHRQGTRFVVLLPAAG